MAYFSSPLPRLRWHYLSPGDRGRIWPIQGLIYTESPRNVHFKMFRYWTTKVEWLFYMKHIQIHVTHFFWGGGVPQGGKTSSFFLIRSFWRWKKNVFLHVIVGAHGELLVQSSVNVTGLLIAPYWTCISPYIGPKKYRSKEWHSICWTHTHTHRRTIPAPLSYLLWLFAPVPHIRLRPPHFLTHKSPRFCFCHQIFHSALLSCISVSLSLSLLSSCRLISVSRLQLISTRL